MRMKPAAISTFRAWVLIDIAILIRASPVTIAIVKYGIDTAIESTMNNRIGTRNPVSAPKSAITPKIAGPEQGAASREYPNPTKYTLNRFDGADG